MFAYCANNPVFSTDNTGCGHIVGAGIQIDGSVSVGSFSGCGGFEVIVYWDTAETEEADRPIVAIYAYGGASLSFTDLSNDIYNIADKLVASSELLQGNPEQVLSGILESVITTNSSFSVSGVIIVGEKNFGQLKIMKEHLQQRLLTFSLLREPDPKEIHAIRGALVDLYLQHSLHLESLKPLQATK